MAAEAFIIENSVHVCIQLLVQQAPRHSTPLYSPPIHSSTEISLGYHHPSAVAGRLSWSDSDSDSETSRLLRLFGLRLFEGKSYFLLLWQNEIIKWVLGKTQ